MSLLNDIVGAVTSKFLGGNDSAKSLNLIKLLIENQGGISNIINKFQSAGLNDLIQSWIGDGKNLPISIDQIIKIFGKSNIEQVETSAGVEQGLGGKLIAEYLPKTIDLLTPNNKVDDTQSNDLLSKGVEALLKNFSK